MRRLRFISPIALWHLLKDSAIGFIDDKGTKLSAALAYYTTFSIPPLLIIIITVAGYFYGEQAVAGSIYSQIEGMVGSQAALQIQNTIKNTVLDQNSWWTTILSVVALLFGATGVFIEIQDSINVIWGLKAEPKKGLIKIVINRLISFSMILSIGFLLLVSLVLNALFDVFNHQLQRWLPDAVFYAIYTFNLIFILLVISTLFATIFKVLPDVRIKWKSVFFGSLFTAILFLLGKIAIGFYLGASDIGSAYGAAGSVVIILVWVYYSAIILFFGAEFTQLYARRLNTAIEPNAYAVFYTERDIEFMDGNSKHTVN